MEIITGACTAIVIQALKRISARYDKETTKVGIYVSSFVMVLIWTILANKGVVSVEMLNTYLTILSSAVATYELLIKRLNGVITSALK